MRGRDIMLPSRVFWGRWARSTQAVHQARIRRGCRTHKETSRRRRNCRGAPIHRRDSHSPELQLTSRHRLWEEALMTCRRAVNRSSPATVVRSALPDSAQSASGAVLRRSKGRQKNWTAVLSHPYKIPPLFAAGAPPYRRSRVAVNIAGFGSPMKCPN
jgi:hypothetical protein